MKRKKTYRKLFTTFLKIGAFTFGGGYAMIPLMEKEVVEKNRWIDEDEILDIIAIAQSTPGPISINTATFIGYKVGGICGSAIATVALMLPSLAIVLLISIFYTKFQTNKWVYCAFLGVRAGVAVLLLKAAARFIRRLKKDLLHISVLVIAFLSVVLFDVNPILVIFGAAILGIFVHLIGLRKGGESEL